MPPEDAASASTDRIPEVVSPESAADYFEVMTRAVFQAGVRWKQIAEAWEAYRKAFAGFDPARVAQFDEIDIDAVLATPGILRMRRKVVATIANARALVETERAFGGIPRICARSIPTKLWQRISKSASRSWAR